MWEVESLKFCCGWYVWGLFVRYLANWRVFRWLRTDLRIRCHFLNELQPVAVSTIMNIPCSHTPGLCVWATCCSPLAQVQSFMHMNLWIIWGWISKRLKMITGVVSINVKSCVVLMSLFPLFVSVHRLCLFILHSSFDHNLLPGNTWGFQYYHKQNWAGCQWDRNCATVRNWDRSCPDIRGRSLRGVVYIWIFSTCYFFPQQTWIHQKPLEYHWLCGHPALLPRSGPEWALVQSC